MTAPGALGPADVPPGWAVVDGALERELAFADFPAAVAYVVRLAAAAEEVDHHPVITIRGRRVTLRWWTHVAGAITERDAAMARRSDELARS